MNQKVVSPKSLIAALVVGALSFGVTAVAYATEVWSNLQYTGTVNGYSYEYQAGVDNTFTEGISGISTVNGGQAPTSYMGALAQLYKAGGALCKAAGWAYNPSPNFEFISYTSGTYCGTGYYYGKGYVRAYNGSGYTTYTQYASPQLHFP